MNKKIVPFLHQTCRNTVYPNGIQRFAVPENLINWSKKYPEYKPAFYESPNLIGAPYADPAIG